MITITTAQSGDHGLAALIRSFLGGQLRCWEGEHMFKEEGLPLAKSGWWTNVMDYGDRRRPPFTDGKPAMGDEF